MRVLFLSPISFWFKLIKHSETEQPPPAETFMGIFAYGFPDSLKVLFFPVPEIPLAIM